MENKIKTDKDKIIKKIVDRLLKDIKRISIEKKIRCTIYNYDYYKYLGIFI